MNVEDARRYLVWADSYSRIARLLELRDHLKPHDWLTLLGEYWDLCDNCNTLAAKLFDSPPISEMEAPVRQLMTDEEWEVHATLPDDLTIYRGCYEGINEDGFSYTLDATIAEKFVTLNGYEREGARPVVLVGRTHKQYIVAYKNGRNEQEIIIRPYECEIIEKRYLD